MVLYVPNSPLPPISLLIFVFLFGVLLLLKHKGEVFLSLIVQLIARLLCENQLSTDSYSEPHMARNEVFAMKRSATRTTFFRILRFRRLPCYR